MNDHPLISVIVPIYNVEKYLNRCIESIVNQTYQNLEIILVDDGSPDNCPRMCDEWARKDERIKVIHKSNGGLSDARNAGMRIARGDYIGFVDSDDWIACEMYEKLVDSNIENDTDISACVIKIVEDNGKEHNLSLCLDAILSNIEAEEAIIKETKLKQPVVYKLYKRESIINIPFKVGKYHEDNFWSYQAIGAASSVSLINYVGYYYWQRQDSIMGSGFSLNRLDSIRAKVERQEYLEMNYPKLIEAGLHDIWFSCLYSAQMSMRHLKSGDCSVALDYIKKIYVDYPIRIELLHGLSFSKKVWLLMSRVSFYITAKVRNLFHIGI